MLHQNVAFAEALLRQHIDGVARASSVSNESGSRARSLVLLTMLAPVARTARLEDQLQLDDEANSQIADRYYTGRSARPCSSGRRFANFQRQRAPAGPPNSGFRADTPRFRYYCAHMCSLSQSGGLVVVFGVSAGRAGPG